METPVVGLLAVGDALNPSDSYMFNVNDFGEPNGDAEALSQNELPMMKRTYAPVLSEWMTRVLTGCYVTVYEVTRVRVCIIRTHAHLTSLKPSSLDRLRRRPSLAALSYLRLKLAASFPGRSDDLFSFRAWRLPFLHPRTSSGGHFTSP